MNLNTILKKAWHLLWSYRALWLFGSILALVGVNTVYPPTWTDWQNTDQWTRIKLSEETTLQVPGFNMIIDFTAPGGIRVINENGITWREFNDLVDLLDREASINLWPILIESAIILVGFLLLGLIARYIVETALIRMVNETEETGRYLGIWEGVRRGFSFRAGKLFLLDLVVCLLVAIISIAIFGLAILPLLLVISGQKAIPITIGVVTFMGMLILAFFLWLAAIAVLSLVLQVIRRACVLEKQSLLDSIRQGILLTKHHLKDIAPLWLVWMGLRLIWVFLIVPVLILFIPFLLLTIPLGVLLGGGPAALVAGITALFMEGYTPWIMGALVGLPIFIVVMISPILFVSGLVEIYKSSIWTLAYHDLKAKEHRAQESIIEAQAITAPG